PWPLPGALPISQQKARDGLTVPPPRGRFALEQGDPRQIPRRVVSAPAQGVSRRIPPGVEGDEGFSADKTLPMGLPGRRQPVKGEPGRLLRTPPPDGVTFPVPSAKETVGQGTGAPVNAEPVDRLI